MKIIYSKKAIKALENIHPKESKKIVLAIDKLPEGDVKNLKGETHRFRLRVGNYRVLYSIEDKAYNIYKIAKRNDVYKGGY